MNSETQIRISFVEYSSICHIKPLGEADLVIFYSFRPMTAADIFDARLRRDVSIIYETIRQVSGVNVLDYSYQRKGCQTGHIKDTDISSIL